MVCCRSVFYVSLTQSQVYSNLSIYVDGVPPVGEMDVMTFFTGGSGDSAGYSMNVVPSMESNRGVVSFPSLSDAAEHPLVTAMLQNDLALNQWHDEYYNLQVTHGMMQVLWSEDTANHMDLNNVGLDSTVTTGTASPADDVHARHEEQRQDIAKHQETILRLAELAHARVAYIRSLYDCAASPLQFYERHIRPLADQLRLALTSFMDALALSTQPVPAELYQHDVTAALLLGNGSGGGVSDGTTSTTQTSTNPPLPGTAAAAATTEETDVAPVEAVVSPTLTLRKPALLELNGQRMPRRKAAWEQRRPMQKYNKVPHLAWGMPYNYVELRSSVDPRQAQVVTVAGGRAGAAIMLCGNVAIEHPTELHVRLPPLIGADTEHSSTSPFPGMPDLVRFPRDRISGVQWGLPLNPATGRHDVPPTPMSEYRLIPPDDVPADAIRHVALLEREFLVPVAEHNIQNDTVVKVVIKGFPSVTLYNEFINDRSRVSADIAAACLAQLDESTGLGCINMMEAFMNNDAAIATEADEDSIIDPFDGGSTADASSLLNDIFLAAGTATTTSSSSASHPHVNDADLDATVKGEEENNSTTGAAVVKQRRKNRKRATNRTTLCSKYVAEKQKITLQVQGRWLIPVWHLFESYGYIVRQKAIARRKLAVKFLSVDTLRKRAQEYVDTHLLGQMIDSISSTLNQDAAALSIMRTDHEQLVKPLSQPLRSYVIEELCKRGSPMYTAQWIQSHATTMRERGPCLTEAQHIQALDAYYWAHLATPRRPEYEKVLEFYRSAGLDVYLKKPYQRTGENRGRSSASGLLRTMRGVRARIYSGASPHVVETNDGQHVAKAAHPRQSKSKYNPGMLHPVAPQMDHAGPGNGPINLSYNFFFNEDDVAFDPSEIAAVREAAAAKSSAEAAATAAATTQEQAQPGTNADMAAVHPSGVVVPKAPVNRRRTLAGTAASSSSPKKALSSWFGDDDEDNEVDDEEDMRRRRAGTAKSTSSSSFTPVRIPQKPSSPTAATTTSEDVLGTKKMDSLLSGLWILNKKKPVPKPATAMLRDAGSPPPTKKVAI